MAQLEEWQLKRQALKDAATTAVELHFRDQRRRAKNEFVEPLLAEFDRRLDTGEALEFDRGDLMNKLKKALSDGD